MKRTVFLMAFLALVCSAAFCGVVPQTPYTAKAGTEYTAVMAGNRVFDMAVEHMIDDKVGDSLPVKASAWTSLSAGNVKKTYSDGRDIEGDYRIGLVGFDFFHSGTQEVTFTIGGLAGATSIDSESLAGDESTKGVMSTAGVYAAVGIGSLGGYAFTQATTGEVVTGYGETFNMIVINGGLHADARLQVGKLFISPYTGAHVTLVAPEAYDDVKTSTMFTISVPAGVNLYMHLSAKDGWNYNLKLDACYLAHLHEISLTDIAHHVDTDILSPATLRGIVAFAVEKGDLKVNVSTDLQSLFLEHNAAVSLRVDYLL